MPSPDGWMFWITIGLLLVGLLFGLGVVRVARGTGLKPVPQRPALGADRYQTGPTSSPLIAPCPLYPLVSAFYGWLEEHELHSDLWLSFDQLIRETLSAHLGATRVRCYHVRPGCDTLAPLSQVRNNGWNRSDTGPTRGPSSREGVLGHVATTGREFLAADPATAPLLQNLAAQGDEAWTCVWPVRSARATIGVLAVHDLRDPAILTSEVRAGVGQIVALCWRHLACLEQLRTARRTDPPSGGLTRQDFFVAAEHALTQSYAENEPVVLVVLALEGLRRLDDAGLWRERDALVKRLGGVFDGRIRSDDLVGRFSDDRFVVLLRRLDEGLGRLIAEKLLTAANECAVGLENAQGQVRVRVGLAGSGLVHPGAPGLGTLLEAAFDAVERARGTNTPIGIATATASAAAGGTAQEQRHGGTAQEQWHRAAPDEEKPA